MLDKSIWADWILDLVQGFEFPRSNRLRHKLEEGREQIKRGWLQWSTFKLLLWGCRWAVLGFNSSPETLTVLVCELSRQNWRNNEWLVAEILDMFSKVLGAQPQIWHRWSVLKVRNQCGHSLERFQEITTGGQYLPFLLLALTLELL